MSLHSQQRQGYSLIRGVCLAVLAACASATLYVQASTAAQPPLHILLTNDDGYEAQGLQVMRRALRAAGFRVSVVAPATQQSGSSMRVSIGTITVERTASDEWKVNGTPADAVAVALSKYLQDDPPDLVVSGANFGQNLGANTNLSGTVGAAIMATQLHVPAIAISVGLRLSERDLQPNRFQSTIAAFPMAAAFVVDLIHKLARDHVRDHPLLPAYTLLNVNYPALPSAEIKGARMARVARAGGFTATYIDTEPAGTVRIDLHHDEPRDDSVAMPDTELFAAGFITVSVLDGSLDGGELASAALQQRLNTLLLPRPSPPSQ